MSQHSTAVRLAPHPLSLGAVALAVSMVTWASMFVSASEAARASAESVAVLKSLLGVPVLEGFRDGDRFGVHVFWGTPALLLVPLVLVTVVTGVVLQRTREPRTAG